MAREYMVIKSEWFFSLTIHIHQCLSVQAVSYRELTPDLLWDR